MNLKDYRIKTIKEFKKEFSFTGDKPHMWRNRVPAHFVEEMDIIAGLRLDRLKIQYNYIQTTFEKTPYENVIFRIDFQNTKFNISKAMIKKIDLDEKIQKILKI